MLGACAFRVEMYRQFFSFKSSYWNQPGSSIVFIGTLYIYTHLLSFKYKWCSLFSILKH